MNRLPHQVLAASREEWRSWLAENHADMDEAWLVFFKKHTGKPCIAYRESVEEALCFGWIDGLKKGIDKERYAYRFTPRRANSKWSPLNISLAEKLIARGQMTQAGLRAFEQGRPYDEDFLKDRAADEIFLAPEMEQALQANSVAWENFNQLAPGYRKQYIGWLMNAKRPETRQKRLAEALRLLEQNKKLGMK